MDLFKFCFSSLRLQMNYKLVSVHETDNTLIFAWRLLFVCFEERAHVVDQCLNFVQSDSIVNWCTNAAHRTMSLQLKHLQRFGTFQEFLLQCFITAANTEHHIHAAAIRLFDGTSVETIRSLNRIVQQRRLFLWIFAHSSDATIALNPFQHFADDVNAVNEPK